MPTKKPALLFFLLALCLPATRSFTEEIVPEGFVLQVLEPTGGKILKAKGWFYSEKPGGKSFLWTLSK